MRKVEVIPYNVNWPTLFEREAEKLQMIFNTELVAIHHIGSTSVRGLQAKPVIDIMPVVNDIATVDRYNKEMENLGYEGKGENGISGRRYFQKGGDSRTHHLHIFEFGSPNIERHLAFRDYLREHSAAMKEYGALKVELAGKYPFDMEAYINGKNQLVKTLEDKALKWYEERK